MMQHSFCKLGVWYTGQLGVSSRQFEPERDGHTYFIRKTEEIEYERTYNRISVQPIGLVSSETFVVRHTCLSPKSFITLAPVTHKVAKLLQTMVDNCENYATGNNESRSSDYISRGELWRWAEAGDTDTGGFPIPWVEVVKNVNAEDYDARSLV